MKNLKESAEKIGLSETDLDIILSQFIEKVDSLSLKDKLLKLRELSKKDKLSLEEFIEMVYEQMY